MDGFNVSYVFNTQTLSLSATDAEINFGTALTITATAPTLTLVTPPGGPESVNVSVTSAMVNVPELHLEGQIKNLSITNDGFNVGSATLTLTDSKPITFGPVSIQDPSLTLTNFGYSLSDGASFNSSLGVGIGEADLNVGSSSSLHVDDLGAGDGHQRDDQPGPGRRGAFHLHGRLGEGQLRVLPHAPGRCECDPAGDHLRHRGGRRLYRPDRHPPGHLDGRKHHDRRQRQQLRYHGERDARHVQGFGVALNVNDPNATASTFQLPTWLPFSITKLALTWPDISDDPADFTIDLSASVNASLGP